MRNLLRSNYTAAFNGTNKYNENVSGGIALWDRPCTMQRAFNPILFVRTRYYHRITTYEPSYTNKPNYVKISGLDIVFDYRTNSALVVKITTDAGVQTISVAAGSLQVAVQDCNGINSIDKIGFTDANSDYCKDTYYTYVRRGYAYCDSLYMCSITGDVLYVSTAVETAYLDIYKEDGTLGQKLAAESFNGIIKFDASPVVKTWFASQLSSQNTGIFSDPKLYARFIVQGIGGAGTSYTHVAVNAVAQIGESSCYFDSGGLILTDFEHLKLYDGFPLDYSILSEDASEDTARGHTDVLCVSRVCVDDYIAELQTEAATDTAIQDESGLRICFIPTFDKKVFLQCAPAQPFYIRWINQQGGVDYYMFSCQQKKQPTIKGVDTHNMFVADPSVARSNSRAYNITTENRITVGAQGIPTSDYKPLSKLPFAPTIEMYDTARSSWVSLNIASFDGSYDTKNATHNIEIVFSLPNINTQF